jgi:hypothetical protein
LGIEACEVAVCNEVLKGRSAAIILENVGFRHSQEVEYKNRWGEIISGFKHAPDSSSCPDRLPKALCKKMQAAACYCLPIMEIEISELHKGFRRGIKENHQFKNRIFLTKTRGSRYRRRMATN